MMRGSHERGRGRLIYAGWVGFYFSCTAAGFGAVGENAFSDARSVGMGGALSAGVDDATAVLINPAALGFMATKEAGEADNNRLGQQRVGWNVLDLGASATLTGKLGDYLQVLVNTDFDRFQPPQLGEPGNITALLRLADTLGNVSDKDTALLNAHAATLMQIGHVGIGFRTYGQVGGWVGDLDLINLGLQVGVDELIVEVRNAMNNEGFDPTGYENQILSDESVQKVRDAFGGSSTNDDLIAYLDYKTVEAVKKYDLDPEGVSRAVDILADIIEASDAGNLLTDNTSSLVGRGFLAAEVPLSYGYALSEHLAIGATVRAIFGRVYGTQVWAFNEDNEDILKYSLDSSVDRVNIGLDLAAMYRQPHWQVALVGHNLNRPRFEGYDQTLSINSTPKEVHVPDIVLDPQVTAGVAWIPTRRLMFTSDVELLETSTLLNNYDIQRVSFGSELDLRLLKVRLGTYRNMAEGDFNWVLTGGIGIQLTAMSFDIGGAVSLDDTVEYDGVDYPRTARLFAGMAMDF